MELFTGEYTENHPLSAIERIQALDNWRRGHPNALPKDVLGAENVMKDMLDAVLLTPAGKNIAAQELKKQWTRLGAKKLTTAERDIRDYYNTVKKIEENNPDELAKVKIVNMKKPPDLADPFLYKSIQEIVSEEIGGAGNIVADNAGKLITIAKQIDNKLPAIGAASTLIDFHNSMQTGDREGAIASFVDLSGQAVSGIGAVTLQPELVALELLSVGLQFAVSIVKTGVETVRRRTYLKPRRLACHVIQTLPLH